MQLKTEWTDQTWNPITGCDKISAGCKNCYADRIAHRMQTNPKIEKYRNGFAVTLHPEELDRKLTKKPKKIFVCSMADIFNKKVPFDFIDRIFSFIEDHPQHTFQILTKRPGIMRDYLSKRTFYPSAIINLWIGTSIEDQASAWRIDELKLINAPGVVKFLSLEPLLGPLELDLSGIDWVIVGGESGPGAREVKPEWIRQIRDQCQELNIPFFFKQWGKQQRGRVLDGVEHSQFPAPF